MFHSLPLSHTSIKISKFNFPCLNLSETSLSVRCIELVSIKLISAQNSNLVLTLLSPAISNRIAGTLLPISM